MKKIMALFLTLTLILTLTTPAFASDKANVPEGVSVSSFTDGEGKTNTVHISSSQIGTAHVDYYIDGVLTSTADIALLDVKSVHADSINKSNSVYIVYNDVANAESRSYIEPLSNYLGFSQITTVSPKAAPAYSYQGRINYNTYYDLFGNKYNDKLSIYQQTGSTTNEYKTI